MRPLPGSDDVAAAMTKLSCFLLVILGATLRPQLVVADDGVLRILQSWNENYGAFAESEQYHYRCVFTRRYKTPDPSFDRRHLDPTLELGLEIFRLGQACRMDVVQGGEFSDFETSGWTHIFDGRAGITSRPQGGGSRYFQIYPANCDLETVRERVEPYADPLADALGLSVDAGTTSWALGVPPDLKPFNLVTALAQGQFHVASQNAEWIELRNAEGDQLTLTWRWCSTKAGRRSRRHCPLILGHAII